MCDEGEKTCPLCAEEMDLTDQQLKPCKCGYEVCVWCWHHIMEMAEKDETEGRCPACRTPYDKEKIVGMAAKCERLVAEINMEKKMKSQKTKVKVAEGRKQLSSVRVIQRNLVYIVGLPLNLADEDILQRKEYFGQYGKVLKVSMSRTAAGVIQQFPNNTCSVYITYAKEEEAIRCIQSVHGFTLEGRPLRACFGTTKYCHAWLRNVPCNNPDCLYLHEIGSQEDSFTKDEIISAYTRVQQITASTNTTQRRTGNVLPPPVDEYCNGSTVSVGKPIAKNPSNSAASILRGSPPDGSTGRSMALPAAASWGMRGLSCSSQSSIIECSNGSSKVKSEPVSSTSVSPIATAAEAPIVHGDVVKKATFKDENHNPPAKSKMDSSHASNLQTGLNSEFSVSDSYHARNESPASNASGDDLSCLPPFKDIARSMPPNGVSSSGSLREPSVTRAEVERDITNERKVHNVGDDISSLSINRNLHSEQSGAQRPKSLVSDPHFIGSPESQGLQEQFCDDHFKKSLASPVARIVGGAIDKLPTTVSEIEEDIISFDNQRLKDPEVVGHSTYMPNLTTPLHVPNQLTPNSLQHHNVFGDSRIADNSFLYASTGSVLSNGHFGNSQSNSAVSQRSAECSLLLPDEVKARQIGMSQGDAVNCEGTGESSIISNILSLDFDSWNDSLTSPHNLAKLLGDSDRQQGSLKGSNHWKVQSSSQSRFSFARQEESVSHSLNLEQPFGVLGQMPRNISMDGDRDLYLHGPGIANGFPPRNPVEPGNLVGNQFATSKSSVSRSQISAPPGFAVPSKAPPPGFSTPDRLDQPFDSLSGNRLLDMPSLLRNATEAQMNGSICSTGDIEFMDPAILAVGKGRPQGGLSNPGFDIRSFPQQMRAFESDARLELFTQRSIPSHQNLGYDIGSGYTSISDSCGIPSRILDPSPVGNLPFAQLSFQQGRNAVVSNGHWNGWNEIQGGNGMAMAELLRNDRERLGVNKLYNGYEDSKYRMPSSGDLYNRTFGL